MSSGSYDDLWRKGPGDHYDRSVAERMVDRLRGIGYQTAADAVQQIYLSRPSEELRGLLRAVERLDSGDGSVKNVLEAGHSYVLKNGSPF